MCQGCALPMNVDIMKPLIEEIIDELRADIYS